MTHRNNIKYISILIIVLIVCTGIFSEMYTEKAYAATANDIWYIGDCTGYYATIIDSNGVSTQVFAKKVAVGNGANDYVMAVRGARKDGDTLVVRYYDAIKNYADSSTYDLIITTNSKYVYAITDRFDSNTNSRVASPGVYINGDTNPVNDVPSSGKPNTALQFTNNNKEGGVGVKCYVASRSGNYMQNHQALSDFRFQLNDLDDGEKVRIATDGGSIKECSKMSNSISVTPNGAGYIITNESGLVSDNNSVTAQFKTFAAKVKASISTNGWWMTFGSSSGGMAGFWFAGSSTTAVYWHSNNGTINGVTRDGNLVTYIDIGSNQMYQGSTAATYCQSWAKAGNASSGTYRAGYSLSGWYTAASGGTQVFNANGTPVNDGKYWKNNLWTQPYETHLYAHWTCTHELINGKGKSIDTIEYGTCVGERVHYKCTRCGADLGYGTDSRNNTHLEPANWTYENNNGITNGYRYKRCDRQNCKANRPLLKSEYNLTLKAGTGIQSVSGSGWYSANSTANINANVKSGYTWNSWTGSSTIVNKSQSLTMNKAYELTANASIIKYKITYNLDGGIVNGTNPTEYTVESDDITLISPEKDGAKFLGWTGSNGSTPQESVTITKGSTGDRTYTAVYAKEFTVIYHNSVGATYSQTVGSNGEFTARKYEECGWSVPDNKKFGSWYNSTYNITYQEGQSVKLSSIIGLGNATELHLYASIKDFEQTLYFDGNKPYNASSDVILSLASKTVVYTKPIGELPVPSLKGWHTKSVGGNIWSINDEYVGPDTEYKYKVNTTAKVIWEPNKYNISYKLNGGTPGDSQPTSALYDIDVNISNPSRDGYTFSGWVITGYDTSTSGHSSSTWTNEKSSFYKSLTPIDGATVTFEAEWQLNTDIKAVAQWKSKTLTNYPKPTLKGWKFIGWYDNKAGSGDKTVNGNVETGSGKIESLLIKPDTAKYEKTLYARWQRTITLTLNLNGGKYINDSGPIVMTGVYYNNADGYEFSLDGTLTLAKLPEYEKQLSSHKVNGVQKGVDAYGKYNSNGENAQYTYISSNGTQYRFLGWSLSPTAVEPDPEFSVFSNSHKTKYRLHESTTLYAVWEPVLNANIQVYRVLGNKNFANGSAPRTSASDVKASDGLQQLQLIAKPGEQCGYTLALSGANNIRTAVKFDTRITDIYDIQGSWTDGLNPSTSEDLVEGQAHGLNKMIIGEKVATRKFFIPQYLGTDKSCESSVGVKVYSMDILIQQNSYYYSKLGKLEEVPVHVTIYITNNSDETPPDDDEIESILNDLRTKLRIRIQ